MSSFQVCSCVISKQDDSELHEIGGGAIDFKLMTGFTFGLTRLSGVVMVAQLS